MLSEKFTEFALIIRLYAERASVAVPCPEQSVSLCLSEGVKQKRMLAGNGRFAFIVGMSLFTPASKGVINTIIE